MARQRIELQVTAAILSSVRLITDSHNSNIKLIDTKIKIKI